jgi:hypothetical protein
MALLAPVFVVGLLIAFLLIFGRKLFTSFRTLPAKRIPKAIPR